MLSIIQIQVVLVVMKKRVAFYVRVSTHGQTVENQLADLHTVAERMNWDVVAIFKDEGISGAKGREKRPAYDQMLKAVVRREVDLIAAWSVDRLGRSLRDLVNFLEEIRERGVDLYLHKQALDTSTTTGRAMFGMMSIFAELERAILIERIAAGQARARAANIRIGRPPTAPEKIEKVRKLLIDGGGIRATAAKAKVSPALVQRIKNELVASGEITAAARTAS